MVGTGGQKSLDDPCRHDALETGRQSGGLREVGIGGRRQKKGGGKGQSVGLCLETLALSRLTLFLSPASL